MFDLKKFSEGTALVTESSKVSYRELAVISEKIGDAVKQRCLVFLLSTNSTAAVAGYIGFINRRIVVMMIDSELNSDFVKILIERYRPRYMWLPKALRENYSSYEETFQLEDYALLSVNKENTFPLNENLALLMTTSGSTGSPKFVRQSYENILANTKSIIEYLNIDSKERAITNLPLSYVYGLSILNTHIYSGASIVLTEKTLFQKEFWHLMQEKEVTNLNGVPYTFSMLERLRFFRMKLPELKTITQAGGKLDYEMHLKLADYAERTGRRFFVMYGAAEATARMGYLPYQESLKKCGSMGIAIPGGRFELVDKDGNSISTQDTVGELIYFGDNVMLGYAENGEDLIRGDETNKRLETGDLAKCDEDGFYTIVGRKKRFLKMFGKRVNLQEIEHILKQKFNLEEVACTGVDDEMKIFLTDNKIVEKIVPYVSEKLTLHPSAFVVKVIDSIPKNSSGKILYHLL
ncbi:MAG: AMP-binding protein [Selenomonadaceae bacterium]|nr:AMP-binding protein [Selenomonadaceae bacterium]